jgi:hypothetical protein
MAIAWRENVLERASHGVTAQLQIRHDDTDGACTAEKAVDDSGLCHPDADRQSAAFPLQASACNPLPVPG